MVFMWSLFSPLIIARPNGGVLDLNLGTQVPRPIIYKTILPNLHDHFAKSTWPVCKPTWPFCKSTSRFCKIHMTIMWIYMTILQKSTWPLCESTWPSCQIYMTIMWTYISILPNPHDIMWTYMTIMWIYMTILQNPHDYSCKSTWTLRKIHMTIIKIKIITVIKCATDRQPQTGGATSHPFGCPLWLSCGWTSIELATLGLLVGR
jgi:hypothetical protein